MNGKDRAIALNRIEKIAYKVYRNHKNALYMLVNDLEEFFEVNDNVNKVNKMTSEEFDKYISDILD